MENEWNKIYESIEDRNQFLRKSWFEAWHYYLEQRKSYSDKVQYELVSTDAEKYAIIPYIIQKKGLLNIACLAGEYMPHRSIPNTGLDKELVQKTAAHLTEFKNVDAIRFDYIQEDDEFLNAVTEEMKSSNIKFIKKDYDIELGRDIPETEEEYLQSFSRKARNKVSNSRNRLEKAGKVEFKYYSDENPDTWKKVFKELAEIEINSWVGESGEPRFRTDGKQQFWNNLVKDEWFSKSIKIIVAYIDDEPASHYVSIDTDLTRYGYDTSYKKQYAKYSIGIILEVETIKQAISLGLKHMNNSYGTQEYKKRWGHTELAMVNELVAFAPTMKGSLAHLAIKLNNRIAEMRISEKIQNFKKSLFLKKS